MYCNNCGKMLIPNSKFCDNCGAPVISREKSESEPKVVYTGVQYKCVHCGEIINSFVATCPSCGYELRDLKVNEDVSKLSKQLNNCSTLEEKIEIIRNFPVPNSREALLEFLTLSKTNIINYDKNGNEELDRDEKALQNAWKSKLDLCYEKAKIVLRFGDLKKYEETYEEITKFLTNLKSEVKRSEHISFFKKHEIIAIVITFACVVSLVLSIISIVLGYVLCSIISVAMFILFVLSLLLGSQVIKTKFKFTYILTAAIGLFLFYPLVVSGISEYKKSNYKDVWESIENKDQMPVTHYDGKVEDDTKEQVKIDYLLSDVEGKEIIELYKNYGYTIESELNTFNYCAYNNSGYFVNIEKGVFVTTVTVTAPMEMSKITWPDKGLATKIPNPNKEYGVIDKNSENLFIVYYKNFTFEEYEKYVDLCMEEGFDDDYIRKEKSFYGKYDGWFVNYYLHVDYIGNSVVKIEVN